jgi:hypothetical protein
MAIQLLSGHASLKAGKHADVKNKLSFALADADADIQVKDAFASLLASVDSKDSKDNLVTAPDLAAQVDTSSPSPALIPLAMPIPFLYTATVPVGTIGPEQGDWEGGLKLKDLAQNLEDRSVGSITQAGAPALAFAPLPAAVPVQSVVPSADAAPMLSVSPLLPATTELTVAPEPAPVLLASLSTADLPSFVFESLDLKRTFQAETIPLSRIAAPSTAPQPYAAPVSPLNGQTDAAVRQWAASLPVVSAPNVTTAPEVRSKTASTVSLAKSNTIIQTSPEVELHFGPLAAQSSLDESGRKNEALLDLLAHGDRLTPQEGPVFHAKELGLVLQRDPDNIVSTHSQSLPPSRTLPSESLTTVEKNSYWVASGTQTVALTLEGLGDESVAVKISLSGVDTRVDIRTDHLALRQMIEGTVQTMKDQLSTEGLTLSGLSVGTPGQDQSMGQSGGQAHQSRADPGLPTAQESGQTSALKNLAPNQSRPVLPKSDGRLSVFA